MKAFKKTLSCILALSITASMMTETLSLGASANATAASLTTVTDGDPDLGDPDPQADPEPQIAAVQADLKEVTITSAALSIATVTIALDQNGTAAKAYADDAEISFGSDYHATLSFSLSGLASLGIKPPDTYISDDEDDNYATNAAAWTAFDDAVSALGLTAVYDNNSTDNHCTGIQNVTVALTAGDFSYAEQATLVGVTSVTGTVTFKGLDYDKDATGDDAIKATTKSATTDLSVIGITGIAMKETAQNGLVGLPTDVYEGDEIDCSGMVIVASTADGQSHEVDYNASYFTVPAKAAKGSNTITVSYFGKTTTFTVTAAENAITAVDLDTGTWNEEEFYVGDAQEKLLKALYDANVSLSITRTKPGQAATDLPVVTRTGETEEEYTYALAEGVALAGDGFVTTSATEAAVTKKIKFTYGGFTAQLNDEDGVVAYTVAKVAPESIELNTEAVKKSYVAGNTVSVDGIVVTIVKNNGDKVAAKANEINFTIDDADFDNEKKKFSADASGDYTVTVSLKDYPTITETFTVTVEELKIIGAEFVGTPETANFCIYDDEPDLTDLLIGEQIRFKYNDDTYGDAFDAVIEGEDGKDELNALIGDAEIDEWDSDESGEGTVTIILDTIDGDDITVDAPVCFYEYVKEIEVTTLPDKTEYGVGTKFDPEGMTVTVTYENDKKSDAIEVAGNDKFKITGFKSTREGTIAPKIKYTGDEGTSASAEFELTIKAAEVDTIAVKTQPKVDYVEGQSFDITGAKALVTYENGIKKTVPITADDIVSIAGSDVESEDDLILGHDLAGTEDVPVIVNVKKYKDEDLTIKINVAEKTVTSAKLAKKPTKLSYDADNDNAWDLTGGVIEIEGNAGKEQFKLDEIDWTDDDDVFEITSFADAKDDADEKGKSAVTIKAGEKEVTFDVTFKKVTAVAVSKAPTKAVYKLHEDAPADLTAFEGGVAKLTFNDKTTATIPLDSELFDLTKNIDTDIPGTQNAVLTYGTGNNKVEVEVPLKVSVPKSITLATKPDRTAKLYVGDDDSKILSYIDPVTIKVTYDDTKIAPEVLTLTKFLQGQENSVKIAKQTKGSDRDLDAVAKDDKKLVFTYTYRYLPADDGASLIPKALTADLAISPVAVAPASITVAGNAKTEYFIGDDLETGKFKVVFTLNNGKTTDPVDVTFDSSSKKWVFEYDGIKGTVDISKYNNTKEGTYKITFAYKAIKATKNVTVAIDPQNVPVTVSGPGIQNTEFINLTDAFKEISKNGTADGEYTLIVDKVTEGMLTFPTKGLNLTLKGKKADSRIALTNQNLNSSFKGNLIIDADIVYYDKKTDEYTNTVALKAAGSSIFIKGDRTFASVSGGQNTVLNTPEGTLTTNKLSSLAGIISGEVTITAGGSLTGVLYAGKSDLTFEAGSTGKIDNLDDCTLTLVKGSETDVKSGLPTVTIGNIKVADAEMKATKEDSTVDLFIVDSEGELITLASGEVVLTAGSAKNDISESVTIWNTTSTGEVLSTYQYGTAIRAEYSDALSLKIGDGNAENYPSFDKVFEAMKENAAKAGTNDAKNIGYEIKANVDSKMTKLDLPKLKYLILSNQNDAKIVISDVASISFPCETTLKDGLVIEAYSDKKGDYATLDVKASENLTLEGTVKFISTKTSLSGSKTLKVNNIDSVDGTGEKIGIVITGFKSLEANGSIATLTTINVDNITLGEDAVVYIGANGQMTSKTKFTSEQGAQIILEKSTRQQIINNGELDIKGTLYLKAGKKFAADNTVKFDEGAKVFQYCGTKKKALITYVTKNNLKYDYDFVKAFQMLVLDRIDISGLAGDGYVLEENGKGLLCLHEVQVSVTGMETQDVDRVIKFSSLSDALNFVNSYGSATDNIVITLLKDEITSTLPMPTKGYKTLVIKGKESNGTSKTKLIVATKIVKISCAITTFKDLEIIPGDTSGKLTLDGGKSKYLNLEKVTYDDTKVTVQNLVMN